MRRHLIAGLAAVAGAGFAACAGGGGVGRGPVVGLRKACVAAEHWDGTRCRARGAGEEQLARGAAAVDEFQPETAVPLLEQARREGPHRREVYARIFEKLGVAYAYLENEAAALEAFDMLLAVEPGHFLSYGLSPKATFLFERAAEGARKRPAPAIDLSWPQELDVSRPVPVEVEVVADPRAFLARGALHVRRAGQAGFEVVDFDLPAVGGRREVTLPALGTGRAEVLEVYVTAFDADGNEVLAWAGPEQPRRIALAYDAPVVWYRKWWVWAIAGGVVAAGTGAAVYAFSLEPPDHVGGAFTSR